MNLLKRIISQLGYGLLVVTLVTILISTLIFLGQVDPARLTFGQRADIETVESKRAELGLNLSLEQQLLSYLGDISFIQYTTRTKLEDKNIPFISVFSHGDKSFVLKYPYLRESFQSGKKVSLLIRNAFPLTLILAVSAFGIALFFGLLFGILASVYYNTWLDKTLLTISSFGYSLPSYVVAMVIAIIFAFYLEKYTGLNLQGSIFELDELGNDIIVWKNLLLPAIALGIRPLSIITQITRSSMLETLSAPYIRTAKAKGLEFSKVVKNHALRNALNPIGTAVSGWFASLLAGAFFVETVFNFKGLGSLTVTALLNYDLPLILGCILFTSVLFVIINILTDLFYILIDPRNSLA